MRTLRTRPRPPAGSPAARRRLAWRTGSAGAVLLLYGIHPAGAAGRTAGAAALTVAVALAAQPPSGWRRRLVDRLLTIAVFGAWAGAATVPLAILLAGDDAQAHTAGLVVGVAGAITAVAASRTSAGRRWLTAAIALTALTTTIIALAAAPQLAVPAGLAAGLTAVAGRSGLLEVAQARRGGRGRDSAAGAYLRFATHAPADVRALVDELLPVRGRTAILLVAAGPSTSAKPAGLILVSTCGLVGISVDQRDPRKALSDAQRRVADALATASRTLQVPAALLVPAERATVAHADLEAGDPPTRIHALAGAATAIAAAAAERLSPSASARRWAAPRLARRSVLPGGCIRARSLEQLPIAGADPAAA